jgi:glycosyltransferase involved in cell wall biosynthesis
VKNEQPPSPAYHLVQVTTSTGWGGRETLPLAIHNLRLKSGRNSHFIIASGTPLRKYTRETLNVIATAPGRLALARSLRMVLRRFRKATLSPLVLSHYTRDLPAIRAALLGDRRIPLVLVKHVGPGSSKRDLLHRFVYRRIDRLLSVSEYNRAKCERVYPLDPSRTGVWYPGVDVRRFTYDPDSRRRLRAAAEVDDETLVLGYLGRITPNKGYEDLLDATARLRPMLPSLQLWFGGSAADSERWYEDDLRARVASLGLDSTVSFCGWQERGEEFLSAIDLFVVPSRRETFGLTTVEAMACKRPVVGFNISGTAEIVADGSSGLLADPSGDAIANLVDAIQSLLRTPERLRAMGKQGRQRAIEVFSHTAMMQRLDDELIKLHPM